MKRLTQWTPQGASLILGDPKTAEEAAERLQEQFKKACNRLAELEDKLESGETVELPCRLGQELYTIEEKREFITYGEKSYRVDNRYCAASIVICEDGRVGFYTPQYHSEFLVFGEDIFATREAAEAKLKELQEQKR